MTGDERANEACRAARVAAIDALLPQTQCTRCGFSGCLPYAEAIFDGTPINRCPPGGQPVIAALAALLGRPVLALDPAHGVEAAPSVAVIDESRCIGCTLCLPACPVDAIVGAGKRLHTVLADACSGCELCLPACPVDCITMQPLPGLDAPLSAAEIAARASRWRERQRARDRRLQRIAGLRTARQADRRRRLLDDARTAIREAVARARARKGAGPSSLPGKAPPPSGPETESLPASD